MRRFVSSIYTIINCVKFAVCFYIFQWLYRHLCSSTYRAVKSVLKRPVYVFVQSRARSVPTIGFNCTKGPELVYAC